MFPWSALAIAATLLPAACKGDRDPNAKSPSVAPPTRSSAAGDPTEFALDNGLRVLLQPIADVENIALVVLFDVGGDHDPEGLSGLAHLVEHVYVTAAAGDRSARSVQEYVERYPKGWNAQTGARYTVIAAVFPAARLDEELADAAARMSDLRPADSDLAREKPRLLAELENMYRNVPPLAAANLAGERVAPSPRGGRHGGRPDQVADIVLDQLVRHWQRFYKPRNATLVLSGKVDTASASAAIVRHFDEISPGEAPASPPAAPAQSTDFARVTDYVAPNRALPEQACTAYRRPSSTGADRVAFLAAVARLLDRAPSLGAGASEFPVRYALLDRPDIVFVCVVPKTAETPAQTIERIDAFVAATLAPELAARDTAFVQTAYGVPLGLQPFPAQMAKHNLYGAAFTAGRHAQLALDPITVRKALGALEETQFRRVVSAVFHRERRAAVVVVTR